MMNWEETTEWISHIKPVFVSVSEEMSISMRHNTDYDTLNFVYTRAEGNQIHRLDFQPTETHTIEVTKYIDTFPLLPKLFRFLHNVIPMFPYMARINAERVGEISQDTESDNLKQSILEHLNNAL